MKSLRFWVRPTTTSWPEMRALCILMQRFCISNRESSSKNGLWEVMSMVSFFTALSMVCKIKLTSV